MAVARVRSTRAIRDCARRLVSAKAFPAHSVSSRHEGYTRLRTLSCVDTFSRQIFHGWNLSTHYKPAQSSESKVVEYEDKPVEGVHLMAVIIGGCIL